MQISAALKIITDMERIGDHAVNIAEWVIFSFSPLREAKHGCKALWRLIDSVLEKR